MLESHKKSVAELKLDPSLLAPSTGFIFHWGLWDMTPHIVLISVILAVILYDAHGYEHREVHTCVYSHIHASTFPKAHMLTVAAVAG